MNVTIGYDKTVMGERMWADQVKSLLPQYVRIIGRVIGAVSIRDIGREVLYNQTIDIPASDATKSRDLVDARDKKWIDIVYGGEYLQQKAVVQILPQQVQQPQIAQQQINLNDLKSFAEQIAQSAADKSVSSIRDMLQDMSKKINSGSTLDANQVVDELLKHLPTQISETKKVDDITKNVFVNLDDGKVLQSNIEEGKLGQVTIRKGDRAKTAIQKLKNIQK